ncbi:rhomboid family intramembrane serine protease [Stenotrophomonas sp. HITSZ_GD]|uniref:rhomboid family intramembrane serine protease n=1 Tax=Stenotrophomonas sp. HITSZ_GD TaxID=3037248 RepID=UPI00240DD6FB|nr:rhomboid family intramembrane serine protease [Stenotrophomonas sp. HITSZ_GD]MDG2524078.1 rhomboid family intramembrane serine protease [Stenotrophomonas sp. HITSZ_GD]
MDLSLPPSDPATEAREQRGRVVRAFNLSFGAVLVMVAVLASQAGFDWRPFAVRPHEWVGLWGLLTAPLLHGSLEHLGANAFAILILGTLAGSVYPKATLRSLPLMWLGSGLGAWWLGDVGTFHLGASGVTHGLMFLLFVLGLIRRDRAAIATSMIAFLFYGGMLLAILPREPGISWQSHMGGAMAGVIGALLFRHLDPLPPRKRYSWEDEEEEDALAPEEDADGREPPRPREVPVLWQPAPDPNGVVIRFRPREPSQD